MAATRGTGCDRIRIAVHGPPELDKLSVGRRRQIDHRRDKRGRRGRPSRESGPTDVEIVTARDKLAAGSDDVLVRPAANLDLQAHGIEAVLKVVSIPKTQLS